MGIQSLADCWSKVFTGMMTFSDVKLSAISNEDVVAPWCTIHPMTLPHIYPIHARNSRSSRRPFDVHTQNLQAVYSVWHRLSYNVQCRYRTSWSSWLNDIRRQSTDIVASTSSGLTNTDAPICKFLYLYSRMFSIFNNYIFILYFFMVLVCWRWWPAWSFACHSSSCHHHPPPSSLAPVRNGDILGSAYLVSLCLSLSILTAIFQVNLG